MTYGSLPSSSDLVSMAESLRRRRPRLIAVTDASSSPSGNKAFLEARIRSNGYLVENHQQPSI